MAETNPLTPSSPQGPETPRSASPAAFTALLLDWGAGNEGALHALMSIAYDELHRQADRALRRERRDHTLQATALINEAYFRLVAHDRVKWHNRAQFFGVVANIIRHILVDYERRRDAAKRGGGCVHVTLEENDAAAVRNGVDDTDILALHDAIEELATVDERQVRVVDLRYFAGFTIEETATILGVDPSTVKRDWLLAKAWLRCKLGSHDDA